MFPHLKSAMYNSLHVHEYRKSTCLVRVQYKRISLKNSNKLKDQPASEAKQLRTYAQIIPGMELRMNLNDNKTATHYSS